MIAAPPPTLEVFYAPSCVPCRLELPVLATFAKTQSGHLRIVIVSEVARARADLNEVSPALAAVAVTASSHDARTTLRQAGDADGILPYARSLFADGMICASWRGALTMVRIDHLFTACARFNAPHLPRS
jgi:thiol-disulfide isomerase/thioredoxin